MRVALWLSKILTALLVVLTTAGAAPVHLRGVQQSESGSGDTRLYDWDTQIKWLDSDRSPFLQVTYKLGEEDSDDPEFKVFEKQHPSRWNRMTEALDSSETGIDVTDGKAFRAGDVCRIVETGEIVVVASISSNTLTVTRGSLGTTATATDSSITNGWIKILGNSAAEGGGKPAIVTTDVSTLTGFCEIFKRGWGVTGTEKNLKRRAGMTLAERQKEALELLREDMEQKWLWGKKRLEVSSGVVTRYTGGINEFVETNRIDLEGGIGYGDIGYLMNVATRFGGKKKIWLCGRDARQQIDSLGLTYLQIGPKDNFLGMAVEKFVSSFGEAVLLTHHGLDNGDADKIFVIDPMHARKKTYRGITVKRNVQNPDIDGEEHYYLTETGLKLSQELAHMAITGATSKVV